MQEEYQRMGLPESVAESLSRSRAPRRCAGPRLCARLPAPGEGAAAEEERAAGCHLQRDPVPHDAPPGSKG